MVFHLLYHFSQSYRKYQSKKLRAYVQIFSLIYFFHLCNFFQVYNNQSVGAFANDFYGTLCYLGLGFASTSSGRVIGCWLGYHLTPISCSIFTWFYILMNQATTSKTGWSVKYLKASFSTNPSVHDSQSISQ